MKMLQYTQLLKKYKDPTAQPMREFVRLHQDDETLLTRIKTLNAVYLMRMALVQPSAV